MFAGYVPAGDVDGQDENVYVPAARLNGEGFDCAQTPDEQSNPMISAYSFFMKQVCEIVKSRRRKITLTAGVWPQSQVMRTL